MDIRGAAEFRQRAEPVEDVQRLAERDSARGRRRHREERVSAECCRYGLSPDRLVAFQIRRGYQAAAMRRANSLGNSRRAAAPHLVDDELRDPATIETVRAFTRNCLECGRKIALNEPFADSDRLAAGKKYFRAWILRDG